MFKFSARLLTSADAWQGVDTKIHTQDSHYWAKKVWNGLRSRFSLLQKQYKIKGVALADWIQTYGIQGMFEAQDRDPAVRKALNEIRAALKETVLSAEEGGEFRKNEIEAFRQEHGSNTADWLFELGGGKRAHLRKRASDNKDKCYYCEAEAHTSNKDGHAICKECLAEDEAMAKRTKPQSKGVISSLLER